MFILHVNPLLPQHMFALVSYSTSSQKRFQDAYEKWGVEREKIIIFFKLNVKDDSVFYTDIFSKKSLKKYIRPFHKEIF